MDTPITISSTSSSPNKPDFLQLNYGPTNKEESVISLGSTSYERVPVSWASRSNTFNRTDSNTSLTNIQKVSNWIKSIEEPKEDATAANSDDDISSSCKESANINIKKESEPDCKSVILFRCDFNKSVSAKRFDSPMNSFSQSTPLMSYIKNRQRERINSLSPSFSHNSNPTDIGCSLSNSNKQIPRKHLLLKRSESTKDTNFCKSSAIFYNNQISGLESNLKVNCGKSDGSSDPYDVPLSPESRKKELCSYLQLMNPADKKERMILQHRRSVRVRNLTAMQERRKQIDDKIVSTDSEHGRDTEKSPALKSFKELNIRVEKAKCIHDSGKLGETDQDVFCFPFPSKELTEIVQDFDHTMSKLVSKYRRICRIKNLKTNYCNIGSEKTTSKPKDDRIKLINNVENEINHKENIQRKQILLQSKEVGSGAKTLKRQKSRLKDLIKKKYKKSKHAKSQVTSKACKPSEKKVTREPASERESPELKDRLVHTETDICRDSTSPRCQIITISRSNDDNHIDMENLMDDMLDFDNLSEEHKKCLIENRILSTKQTSTKKPEEGQLPQSDLQSKPPLYRVNKSDLNQVNKICEIYKNSLLGSAKSEVAELYLLSTDKMDVEENTNRAESKTEEKSTRETSTSPIKDSHFNYEFECVSDSELDIKDDMEPDDSSTSSNERLTNGNSLQEHNYAGAPSDDEEDEEKDVDTETVPNKNPVVANCIEVNPGILENNAKYELLPYNKPVEVNSLHKSLQVKRKNSDSLTGHSFHREWESDNLSKQKSKKQSHYISINKQNGAVLKAFYIDFNLILCQENVVSFWMQTPLGNVLGSQNMWIPRGQTQRLVLNGKCVQKESMEMVISMETQVAYVELWTKEHKSDIREGPVADVFATVYFWKQRQNGLDKKVLQLENIKGFADDVQYSVMKNVPKIIVSWHSAHEDNTEKKTFVHAYRLAPDFQTVDCIYNIEPVDHYVSSLHNIEECDNLIMGCGENKITLWNLDYGYTVATIVLAEIKSPLSTLWVKCDRGFLFALQQCVDRELRLIAINGINHSWKKLASYIPPEGFDRLRGVCLENGLLLSFYDQGILCWNAETGEPVEESNVESEIMPSGKYIILIEDDQILVKHAMTHLMSVSIDET
ncbi:hypothetical protein NQ315_001917 [Exocentrus adspersus]|uniref:Uncharacterized protein n=1 Tax=Exocentrus adspersus TaxID=1586481 RepID=A0AAV8WA16_9CUCU|nr:hypothetical protein NQ315_001917 [Exocentrus adspersus]